MTSSRIEIAIAEEGEGVEFECDSLELESWAAVSLY